MIRENITITPYDKTRSVISTQTRRNILVNNVSVVLIDILKSAPDMKSAQEKFNARFNANLNVEQFEAFIQDKLGRFGILQHTTEPAPKKSFDYLLVKFEFISPRIVALLSTPLKFLYKPKVFWGGFFITILFLTTVLWRSSALITFDFAMIYKIGGVILLSFFVHELGHTTACVAAGVKPGGIGVGLYYFLPVLYADITSIWSAKREMRIIANLGGIYSELILSSVLAAIFLVTSQPEYLASALYLFVSLSIQLNPLVRLDGYWVLSDVTNTPNLLPKSNQALASAIKRTFRRVYHRSVGAPEHSRKKVLLTAYGIANWVCLFLFVAYTMTVYHRDLIGFPSLVMVIFERLSNFDLHPIEITRRFIIVVTFYFLFIRLAVQVTTKILRNRLKKVGLAVKPKYTL